MNACLQESYLFVKVELVLPHVRAHPENMTCQISLSKQHVHGNRGRFCVQQAMIPAWQLQDGRVELLYGLHKLTNADALGLLEHIRDVVLLLLSHVIDKNSKKEEHHKIVGPFYVQPWRSVQGSLAVCFWTILFHAHFALTDRRFA